MIIVNPLILLLHLINLAIDVTIFFLTVRFVLSIRSFRLLVHFDKAGEGLVNATLETVSKTFMKVLKISLPEKYKIATTVMLLMSINVLLVWISKSVC